MTKPLFATGDIFVAAAICYTWGNDALARIVDEESENRRRSGRGHADRTI